MLDIKCIIIIIIVNIIAMTSDKTEMLIVYLPSAIKTLIFTSEAKPPRC